MSLLSFNINVFRIYDACVKKSMRDAKNSNLKNSVMLELLWEGGHMLTLPSFNINMFRIYSDYVQKMKGWSNVNPTFI
jgi:hypothetical protein